MPPAVQRRTPLHLRRCRGIASSTATLGGRWLTGSGKWRLAAILLPPAARQGSRPAGIVRGLVTASPSPNIPAGGQYKLVVNSLDPTATWFTDRPNRLAGTVQTRNFLNVRHGWGRGGHGSCGPARPPADPPARLPAHFPSLALWPALAGAVPLAPPRSERATAAPASPPPPPAPEL